MVTLDRIADQSEAERAEARELSRAVYPPEWVKAWPGLAIEWADSRWCVRVRDEAGALVSYVGVHLREARHEGRAVRVGGIGGVKTHPEARGHGFARRGIERAVEHFGQEGADFGLLVCEADLIAYYSRLGWREFAGTLLVRQRGEEAEFTFNRVMTIPVGADAPVTGTIDLCGPPW